MNSKIILLAATLVGGLLSSAVVASSAVVIDSALMADTPSYSAPAPVKVVSPTGISRRYKGETIRLSLKLDAAGQPQSVNLLSGRDPNLVRNLLPAVAQWQFAPAMKNGKAVPATIVLPIELVD